MNQSSPTSQTELRAAIKQLTLRDAHRFGQRLRRARNEADINKIARGVQAAMATVERRRQAVPTITYPASLPVSERRTDIADAIRTNQVVIVAGETGSGKTTQLPKICMELGRGILGTIGHTQPRRLAARTVAERIADELQCELGSTVGYTVRFTDQVSDSTLVKLMTDGILLNEIQRDRMLRRYDTIIIDEAHERSLNIDFILGYLKQLLPRRPDLKVIITSATIDPQRFAEHFSHNGVPAPIVEVSGRTFPVEMRYRPLVEELPNGAHAKDDFDDEVYVVERDPIEAISDAVEELVAEGPGDILVFLSGEREIRDTADALDERKFPNTEVVPLYARLSQAEQHKVFAPHRGRRIVLATNVAETSLTVPGIRYVIDPGFARISRYSLRTKVQRLPIEPISQASARQRSGRCGRVADGICIRLYSEQDFDSRPVFTDPEIQRTNLAAVVLHMAALGLGDVGAFPFIDPPDERNIKDGVRLLQEIGAIAAASTPPSAPARNQSRRQSDQGPQLTDVGRQLAQLPVDPRMGRMLVEAHNQGCLNEVLTIVAGLSIQDVRERPSEHQQHADELHRRFTESKSDFLAYLELWEYIRTKRHELSSSQFRKLCRAEFLHWQRIREWQDLRGQLNQICSGLGWMLNSSPASPDTVHQALLSGLLSHIGIREADTREFVGARNAKFAVFPGSVLAKKPPQFVMASELVETSRLWARTVAKIEPEWAEKLAGDLVKRTYSEPHWSTKQGAVLAYERVTLFGVPLAAQRRVNYGRIDVETARELFIRHALVQGEWEFRHEFFHHNRKLLDDIEDLEHRARRRGIVVDDETLFDFYDARVPDDVVSVRHFDSWWKKKQTSDPELLFFTSDTVVNPDADAVRARDFPDAWKQGELLLPLSYHFEPGHPDDGVTVMIPVAQLERVRSVGFEWLVPGLRDELAAAMVKTLPKPLRRSVVPAPEFGSAALSVLKPRSEPLTVAFARELSRLGGVRITPTDFDIGTLPLHLRMTFAAVDARGGILKRSKDLESLRESLSHVVSKVVATASAGMQRPPAWEWTPDTLGTLTPVVEHRVGGQVVRGYPSLVLTNGGVAVQVVATRAVQQEAMQVGVRALIARAAGPIPKSIFQGLSTTQRLALNSPLVGGAVALAEDCRNAAIDALVVEHGGVVFDPVAFAALSSKVRAGLMGRTRLVLSHVVPVLTALQELLVVLDSAGVDPVTASAVEDVRNQINNLVFPGFVTASGLANVTHMPRYISAAQRRIEALPGSSARELRGMAVLDRVFSALSRAVESLPTPDRTSQAVDRVHWMIEELRVSLFAQALGTAGPISEQRVATAIKDLAARR
ncbi:ATP-dependent RNA helicase HrpA [Hoyosella rhizosphaerae]|uniref:RNA helicase n=1 Tax=Hoyosella rhizosphaerae TaxID=1755582 RepID=A0A916U502_9ACTN|nr:ATP-dependent RNA helicase HrpA [Hoyosella rhizosphaerae]MBN4926358.1 ATP-dependent RNA helicase HrpA [Hoyosella rhizosphaerae]GGC60009.1 ATP-dependent helicase [Hoyosella rhizosphaerae]